MGVRVCVCVGVCVCGCGCVTELSELSGVVLWEYSSVIEMGQNSSSFGSELPGYFSLR